MTNKYPPGQPMDVAIYMHGDTVYSIKKIKYTTSTIYIRFIGLYYSKIPHGIKSHIGLLLFASGSYSLPDWCVSCMLLLPYNTQR